MQVRVRRTVPALLVLLCGSVAHAQLALEWEAPLPCPRRDEVHDEVRRLLGGTIPEPLDLSARGLATRDEGQWTLSLRTTMDGVEGHRVIEGDACEELGAAAALILALMIDPQAVVVATDPEPPEPPPTPAAIAHALGRPLPTDPAAPARVRVTPREPPTEEATDGLGGSVGVGGLLDVGSVPDVSGGITVEGAFGIPLVEARLRATFVFPRRAARDAISGADITSTSIDARVCVHPFDDARYLHGCVGFLLAVAIAEGIGLDRTETGIGTYAGGLAGLGLAWRPEAWFDLELEATLIVHFNPLQFAVRGSPDVVFHEMAAVAGRFALGAHVHF